MTEFRPTALPDVVLVLPERHDDARGFFAETFRADWFPRLAFIQDNHSHSNHPGTIRGLHYQEPPVAQAKLVRVAQGRIRDLAVDIRRDSATFLKHVAIELSAEGGEQLLVPEGFAHGFVTLEPDTVVLYRVSAYYSREAERGIAWDDPALAIDWGSVGRPILSDRDAGHPPFDPASSPFGDGA